MSKVSHTTGLLTLRREDDLQVKQSWQLYLDQVGKRSQSTTLLPLTHNSFRINPAITKRTNVIYSLNCTRIYLNSSHCITMYTTTNLVAMVVVDSTKLYSHWDRRRPLNILSSNMIFHHSPTQFTITFSLNTQMPSFSSKKDTKFW